MIERELSLFQYLSYKSFISRENWEEDILVRGDEKGDKKDSRCGYILIPNDIQTVENKFRKFLRLVL